MTLTQPTQTEDQFYNPRISIDSVEQDLFHNLTKPVVNADDALIPEQTDIVIQTLPHHFAGLTAPILIAEDSSGGCGGKTWEAAGIMCDFMIWKQKISEGNWLKGKRVLELGSGTGLVGLVAGRLGEQENGIGEVIITDMGSMLLLMNQNIALNNLQTVVNTSELTWGEPISHTITSKPPDIILASDCVYLEIAFEPLVKTLNDLATAQTEVYMSYKKRRKADKRFFKLLGKKFEFTEVKEDPNYPIYSRQSLYLYKLTKK